MNITDITTRAGAHRKRTRVGRGEGSGLGKTSGRGHKGQGARAGGKPKGGLGEGGMFPLFRRLPKVGFNNANFRVEYQVVNVTDLDARFEAGGHVTAALLEEVGLIRDRAKPVKVLGDGEIGKRLTVEAQRFSGSAASKIEACGGQVVRLGPQPKKKFIKRPAAPQPKAEKPSKKKEAAGEAGDQPEAKPAKQQKGPGKKEASDKPSAEGTE
jgi:large subunit ribosomal protein L15